MLTNIDSIFYNKIIKEKKMFELSTDQLIVVIMFINIIIGVLVYHIYKKTEENHERIEGLYSVFREDIINERNKY